MKMWEAFIILETTDLVDFHMYDYLRIQVITQIL